MEIIKVENLSFTYPGRENKALSDINISVEAGEFITLMGKSGCGKTTLLRFLKSSLAPFGEKVGRVYFSGEDTEKLSPREEAAKIGFVMQSPDNQIVTDKVWHELAFGLESLGCSTAEIRVRVAEMASFFGIENWFHKKVEELSGGEKQLLNLASLMVMQPSLLILDEPTSQLDPIAAGEFLKAVEKINRELGITVILSEHRLEEAFALSDRVIVLDEGKVIADDTPRKVGEILKAENHDMYISLPTPMRIYGAVENDLECPLTVREGRNWLFEYSEKHPLNPELLYEGAGKIDEGETVIEIKDVFFRYEKNLPDTVKGLNAEIKKGELFAILGGNGTGKTTTLSLISGLLKPYRGEIKINGEKIEAVKDLYDGILGVLPQNPRCVFSQKTVYSDLLYMLSEKKLSDEEKEKRIKDMAALCRIEDLLIYHPYDLSGGEMQRAALAKVLLTSPEILLLDEPTKGFDASFKLDFAEILTELKKSGVTIVMVSHDIEFSASFADRCALFFDGNITSEGKPREFFKGKNFYTTATNRMARNLLPEAVFAEDVILACKGKLPEREKNEISIPKEKKPPKEEKKEKKKTSKRVILGSFFTLLFIITSFILNFAGDFHGIQIVKGLSITYVILAVICFFPQGKNEIDGEKNKYKKGFSKRTLVSCLLILLAIPLTIFLGIRFFDDRKYYFISLLIMLETVIPFLMVFEKRKPKARELVLISVLCAIAVAGREAFFMLPQFKPVLAIIILAGVTLGGETGFLVGAVTGFVSNFFFGQGPWTTWQMFALGIVGFLAGILFSGFIKRTKVSLSLFGFISAIVIYGGIMNPASVIMWQDNVTAEMIIAAYIRGLEFDLIHALSTFFFLWFISEAMMEKIERIKIKYGLIAN